MLETSWWAGHGCRFIRACGHGPGGGGCRVKHGGGSMVGKTSGADAARHRQLAFPCSSAFAFSPV